MLLFLVQLFFVSGYALERMAEPSMKDSYPSPGFYRLTKVLGRTDFYDSHLDFRFEVARNSFSEGAYSDTCSEAFLAMKFTPQEMNDLGSEFIEVAHFVLKNNVSGNVWIMLNGCTVSSCIVQFSVEFENLAPSTFWFLNSRLETLEKLSQKALPETRQFIQEASNITMDALIKLLRIGGNSVFEKWVVERSFEMASKYRGLSKEIKRDIEESFCARNALNWINTDMKGLFDDLFNSFTEEVGLNLHDLLKGNEYLSSLPIKQVENKFKIRAEILNLTAQEYVDNCASMFSVMKLDADETREFNRSFEDFMGKEWARKVYISVDDLLDALVEENAPFIKIVNKRWNFIMLKSMTPLVRYFFASELDRLAASLLYLSNRAKVGDQRKLNASLLIDHYWYNRRQLEQHFCLQSTLESIVEREFAKKEWTPLWK